MRPVNLIPPSERRGESAPARGRRRSLRRRRRLLVAILFAVTGVVLADNSVKDKESSSRAAETKRPRSGAGRGALPTSLSFQQMQGARVADDLRAGREPLRLGAGDARALPGHPRHRLADERDRHSRARRRGRPRRRTVPLRATVDGPALELVGCARSQRDVAAMISAIGDIDGVTRVLAEKSEKPNTDVGATGRQRRGIATTAGRATSSPSSSSSPPSTRSPSGQPLRLPRPPSGSAPDDRAHPGRGSGGSRRRRAGRPGIRARGSTGAVGRRREHGDAARRRPG